MHYDLLIARHLEIIKTLKLIQQRYDALVLRNYIKDYIS